MSDSLSPQVGEEGAEEGAHEGVLQESHVMERVGGVQQRGNCRGQLGEEIHLWKIISFQLFKIRVVDIYIFVLIIGKIDIITGDGLGWHLKQVCRLTLVLSNSRQVSNATDKL